MPCRWALSSLAAILLTWILVLSPPVKVVYSLAQSQSTKAAGTTTSHDPRQHRRPLGATTTMTMHQQWTQALSRGYSRRLAADPAFPVKSVTEVVLAASTQLVAEYHNRGSSLRNLLFLQVDFVVPAVLTAILGKYLSLWKTAPTLDSRRSRSAGSTRTEHRIAIGDAQFCKSDNGANEETRCSGDPKFWGQTVPTNAFQATLMDGVTVPTRKQRVGSLFVPMLPLFRAGCLASFIGYSLASAGVAVRTWLWPSFATATQPVNIVAATLYTGCFMAVVSNLRYQFLQGVVEPVIDRTFSRIPLLRAALVFAVKVANGFLGSSLAIAGMQLCGLQRMK